jgi:hypothetical protein
VISDIPVRARFLLVLHSAILFYYPEDLILKCLIYLCTFQQRNLRQGRHTSVWTGKMLYTLLTRDQCLVVWIYLRWEQFLQFVVCFAQITVICMHSVFILNEVSLEDAVTYSGLA